MSRAEELHLRAALAGGDSPAFDSVLSAAEEMGIPRDAMRRALEEKLGKPMETPAVGQMVFAKSADGNYYVAEVVEAQKGNVRVRFISGGEDFVSEDALQPCKVLPGMKLSVQWPWWGWYKSDVMAYDEKSNKLLLSDGWQEKQFHISEIRIEPEKVRNTGARTKLYWTLLTLGAALCGSIGTLMVRR